jgi:hypothetical protein
MAEVIAGAIPLPGQTVYLGREASPQFRAAPIRMMTTEPAQPSSVDLAAGRDLHHAGWLLLTGWELDGRGRRTILRTVSVRRMGLIIVVHRD